MDADKAIRIIIPVEHLAIVQRIKECDPSLFSSIEAIYNTCEEIITQIPVVFPNYTIHDIGHSIRVVEYMNDLIADRVQEYSPLHLAIIVIVGIIHDIGMVVSTDEKAVLYQKMAENDKTFSQKSSDDKLAILQNYVRNNHGRRVKKALDYEINGCTRISSYLHFGKTKSYDLSDTVADICQSHCEDIDWIKKNLLVDKIIGNDRINPQHIAVLLRIGDALDIDDRRAPYSLYRLLNPTGKSDEEWKKHIPITNYKKVVSSEAGISLLFAGECNNPRIYRSISSYIDWLQRDIDYATRELGFSGEYVLPISGAINKSIKTIGFRTELLSFRLEYKQIVKLLMGEKIYGSKRDGIRELLQNAVDAALLMKSIAESDRHSEYRPIIGVEVDRDADKVIVFDNGTGMNEEILRKYFFNIGSSYYTSEDFLKNGFSYIPIGHFGIGFLACFMLSSQVEICTRHYHDRLLIRVGLDKDSPFITRFDDNAEEHFRDHGTEVCIKYSEMIPSIFDDEDDLKHYIETTFLDPGISFRFIDNQKKLEILSLNHEPAERQDIFGGHINTAYSISEKQFLYNIFDDFDSSNSVVYIEDDDQFEDAISTVNGETFGNYLWLPLLREYIAEIEAFIQRSGDLNNTIGRDAGDCNIRRTSALLESFLNGDSIKERWTRKYRRFIMKYLDGLTEYYSNNRDVAGYFNRVICKTIIQNDELQWVKLPVIANQEMFDAFLELFKKYGVAESIKEFSPHIRWLQIFFNKNRPNRQTIIQIISEFLNAIYDSKKTPASQYNNYPIPDIVEKKCKRKITCTYQRAARYEIMEWEVAERFGKWRNVPEYSETALEG